MHNSLADLQSFMHTVEQMRARQKAYFASRNEPNLRLAKASEKEVDQALQVLAKKGYKPNRPEQPKQQQIF